MRTIYDYQREVGMAVWLFIVYWQNHSLDTKSEWNAVSNGSAIRDSDVAKFLKIRVATATRWRRRLRDSGLIRCEASRGGGFQVWILNLNRSPEIDPGSREVWPEMQTEMVQKATNSHGLGSREDQKAKKGASVRKLARFRRPE